MGGKIRGSVIIASMKDLIHLPGLESHQAMGVPITISIMVVIDASCKLSNNGSRKLLVIDYVSAYVRC